MKLFHTAMQMQLGFKGNNSTQVYFSLIEWYTHNKKYNIKDIFLPKGLFQSYLFCCGL